MLHTRNWHGGKLPNGRRTAIVTCPVCGLQASLSGHQIADNGVVTPSLVCPRERCSFHDYVTLIGWTDQVQA